MHDVFKQALKPFAPKDSEVQAASPTPWELSAENPRLIMKDVPGMSDGFDQYCIAETHYHPLLGHKEAKANAAFIVKAVNCHDDLVEALKTAETALEALHVQLGCWKIASAINVDGIRRAALAALAKAGE